jgi:hypothetical protein
MPIGTILLVILVLLLIGALPAWPAAWGPFPAGILGVALSPQKQPRRPEELPSAFPYRRIHRRGDWSVRRVSPR